MYNTANFWENIKIQPNYTLNEAETNESARSFRMRNTEIIYWQVAYFKMKTFASVKEFVQILVYKKCMCACGQRKLLKGIQKQKIACFTIIYSIALTLTRKITHRNV